MTKQVFGAKCFLSTFMKLYYSLFLGCKSRCLPFCFSLLLCIFETNRVHGNETTYNNINTQNVKKMKKKQPNRKLRYSPFCHLHILKIKYIFIRLVIAFYFHFERIPKKEKIFKFSYSWFVVK